VQKIRNLQKKQNQKRKISNDFEERLLKQGYDCVIGIDEVGRGCWAGPVYVGGFVYNSKVAFLPTVNDSKKITKKRRESLYEELICNKYAVASASVEEIDSLNIVQATHLAIQRVVNTLSISNAYVIIDGYFKEPFDFKYKCINKGDEIHYSIAAASILAKVSRDRMMIELSEEYPEYGFDAHVGYGTKKHREALTQFGVCTLHRKSYKPIKDLIHQEL
jgi:ribonuclease HII